MNAIHESDQGVTLHLKATAPAARIAVQLRCHLAFAKATDFAHVPCPVFIKGVSITVREGLLVRREARKMFGEVIVAQW